MISFSLLIHRASHPVLAILMMLGSMGLVPAQEQPELTPQQKAVLQKLQSIPWQSGPMTGEIGSMARIHIPEGYDYVGAKGAQTLLEAYGNPLDTSILAAIVPQAKDKDWTLIFKFDDIGYVKDEDKDSLDAEKMLATFQASLPAQNAERRAMGGEEILKFSWTEKPFYDQETKNLTWALRLHFPSGDSINYDIRILGRRGVMEATLLGDPEGYRAAVPEIKTLLTQFSYNQGNTYAEWQSGDRVAQLGLAGLIGGGATLIAAKTGLLAKLGVILAKGGKAIIVGILVLGATIWTVIKRVFGFGKSSANE
jgi:uncharacterized membrane-anchored protein